MNIYMIDKSFIILSRIGVFLFKSRRIGLRTCNIPFRHLPSIWIGIPIIWLEDSSVLRASSMDSKQMTDELYLLDECYLICYSNVSKCVKFLKRTQFYDEVIVIMVINTSSMDNEKLISVKNDVFRLHQYKQVQSILIIYLNENGDRSQTEFFNETFKKAFKVVGIFHDYYSMLIQLQQLLNNAKKTDDGLFSIFNSRGKVLRDVQNELGPFVWYQSYRG